MSTAPPSPTPTLLRPPSFHPATVEWTPGSQPRYVVINPMHIISLQDKTKTFAVRVVEKIKAISEKWFTHVLLLIFLLIYASVGALMFQWIEAPIESREKTSINRTRILVIQQLWRKTQESNLTKEEWEQIAFESMMIYEEQVFVSFSSGVTSDSETTVWTFWGALFYCGTVFTTIGYGNIVPATTAGRAATIIYAFIGIPFLLMVLADLGKLFTRAIKACFYYIKLFYHTGNFRKARRMGRRATAVPVQYMTVAWNKMPYIYPNRMKKKRSVDITSTEGKDVESGNNNDLGSPDKPEADAIMADGSSKVQNDVKGDKKKDKEKKKDKDKDKTKDEDNNEEEDGEVGEEEEGQAMVQADEVNDEFNLPVSLAVILLVGYMMLGAVIFTFWEDWTFFESFYFVFISMSTIGFGDYVPDHPMYMMATFIYLLFGLALTSMCINIVQEKLSATFQLAKLRIGTTMGLDATILMEDDYTSDGEKSESPDSQGKKESMKRRGSKAPKAHFKDDEIEKVDSPTSYKENDVSSKSPLESTPSVNHK